MKPMREKLYKAYILITLLRMYFFVWINKEHIAKRIFDNRIIIDLD